MRILCHAPLKIRNIAAASDAPRNGPRIGTHAYFQSLSRLPGIGRRKCIFRGPRSRAGFIAYPVGPPMTDPAPGQQEPPVKHSKRPIRLGFCQIKNCQNQYISADSFRQNYTNSDVYLGQCRIQPALNPRHLLLSKCFL